MLARDTLTLGYVSLPRLHFTAMPTLLKFEHAVERLIPSCIALVTAMERAGRFAH